MKRIHWIPIPKSLLICTVLLFFGGALFWGSPQQSTPAADILTQLRQIPTATLADAVDEVVGKRGFMSHEMRPIAKGPRIAGRAKTVVLGPRTQTAAEKSVKTHYTVETIDESGSGDVLVIANGDLDIAAFGGLMATAAKIRGIEGVIIDGAVRDVEQIEELGLSVFSRSTSPATGVGRQFTLSREVPVLCGGVTVYPADYIVADRDGVTRIPAQHIQAVLRRALELEETEKKMTPMIKKLKSLGKVIQMFQRI